MAIKLIVGLQNPGQRYAQTRHNAGGWFVEALSKHYEVALKFTQKLHGELATISEGSSSSRLLLPSTFMNHSGLAVRSVCQFYQVEPEEVLVVHDELDIEAGKVKFKSGGGHAGHNGLRDIIAQLGNPAFHRLRIGIGHPGQKHMVLDYVLGKPTSDEKTAIFNAIEKGIAALPFILKGDFPNAQNRLA